MRCNHRVLLKKRNHGRKGKPYYICKRCRKVIKQYTKKDEAKYF
jgi:DNA-directed RNA polymerase subunit RPC12/RpoP